MHVALIASTVLHSEFDAREEFRNPIIERWMQVDDEATTHGDALSEFAGRSCYQAWSKKNPATAHNEGYLANILKQGHESVLEHSSLTFYLEGVSRSLTHELIRHRHLSFSQQSQRYVDESNADYVLPPLYRDHPDPEFRRKAEGLMAEAQAFCLNKYEELVELGEEYGEKRKRNRSAARGVLPNATETRIVVTGNLRAWRHVIHMRHSEHADEEIAELAGLILQALRQVAPHAVQDIPDEKTN